MSRLFKVFLIVFFLVLWPKISQAVTLNLIEENSDKILKSWDLDIALDKPVASLVVFESLSITELTRQALFGEVKENFSSLLVPTSASALKDVLKAVNQPPRSAKLIVENNRATDFDPGQTGRSVDLRQLKKILNENTTIVSLPVFSSQPNVSLADINYLGIKELVATGESNFSGSPSNRIHNIQAGASKYNGLIIKQGKEFSFNKYLGDVDAANGFLPELVIKRNGVVPEFGGGLCQVSSTVFRVAMNAGLPITARRNHSFAVSYYTPQGTDATIYPGSQDLKFINDLSSAILIRTRIEAKKLFFDFYGTKDRREVVFDGPAQYDKKSDGSLKAIWTRRVSLNGNTTEQVFKSSYLSPALFKREEVAQASTPNPEAENVQGANTSNVADFNSQKELKPSQPNN